MKIVTINNAKKAGNICLLAALLCATTLLAVRGHAKPLAADVAAGPRLTEARAIQIARDYCQKIGQPVTATGKATFPATADYDTVESWLPMWRVYFSHQAEVHVVDRTAAIVHYTNFAYHQDDFSAPGQALSKVEALRIARTVLDATGQREELGNETALLQNSTTPPSYQGNEWDMRWDRMHRGVLYLDEGVGLSMNAQTGEIEVIVLSFPSLPLLGTEAEGSLARAVAGAGITPEQAVGVGAEFLAVFRSLGRPAYRAVLRDPTPLLRLVRPKDGWSHFQDAPGQSRAARPAWIVRMLYRTDTDGEQDVWVDAETGEVLGEENASGGFGGTTQAVAPSTLTLAQMLGTARTVCVLRSAATTKEGWKAAAPLPPGGKGPDKDQAPALAALRVTADSRTDAPAGVAPQQVVLVGEGNAVAAYSYYPDTGLLGQGADWVAVPDAFKAWMQKRIADAPVTPKK